jgi:Tol biopolymer transport system component
MLTGQPRPAFSPDDQTFLFQSREGGEKFAIYRAIGLEYEVLRREADPIQGETPAWTPDGNRFVYKGCLGSNCGLILSNLDGSFPLQLTQNLSDTNPAVSPDGRTIAFMSGSDRNWDIYIMGIDVSGRKALTDDPGADGLPTWSPDGKTIAFVSTRSGQWAMWAMDADGGNQRLLFELGGSIDGKVQVDVQNSNGWLEESIDWAP